MISRPDLLSMSLSSLLENKLRAFLSLLGITIGIAAVFVIVNVSQGGKQVIFSELETLGLTSAWIYRDASSGEEDPPEPENTGIDMADYAEVSANCCEQLSIMSPVINFQRAKVQGQKVRPLETSVQGVNEQYLLGQGYQLLLGRKLSAFDVDEKHKVAVITESVRDELGLGDDKVIGSVINLYDQAFTIVGLIKNKDLSFLASIGSIDTRGLNNYIYIPHSVALSLQSSTQLSLIYLETRDAADLDEVTHRVERILLARHQERFKYKMDTMDFYIAVAENILGNVTSLGVLSALATVLVGSIGIMNMMSTSVVERTSEIGLRKAIGASGADIKMQILLESLMLTAVGSFIGILIGAVISHVAASLLDIQLDISLWSVLVSIGITVFVGLISGYMPARRAAAISPVEALNHD